jgi:ribosome-binding protein aMBF1 (putative translation factor)
MKIENGMINGIKVVTMEEVHSELLKKPGYKEAYDALEVEFALHDALIKMRIKGEMTQAQLAEKMGTKQSAIARFESGRSNPTFDFIQRLATALGLKLSITVQ